MGIEREHAYYRKDLALEQLETALRLYFECKEYASVITLAGAADEVFGKLLAASGEETSLESLIKAVNEIHKKIYGEPTEAKFIARRANNARNNLKHWDIGDDVIIKLNLKTEAQDMLNRAIDNYWSLEQMLTPAMEKFQRAMLAT